VPESQKIVLHKAARFDPARLVVIALGRRAGAVAEQSRGNADVGRIVDRDARHSAISKQVRINGLAQSFERAHNDAAIDPIVGHGGTVHRKPQCVA
jgi:hypothetical protein